MATKLNVKAHDRIHQSNHSLPLVQYARHLRLRHIAKPVSEKVMHPEPQPKQTSGKMTETMKITEANERQGPK